MKKTFVDEVSACGFLELNAFIIDPFLFVVSPSVKGQLLSDMETEAIDFLREECDYEYNDDWFD